MQGLRSQTPSSVFSTPSEVSAVLCVLFGNPLRALFLKNRDFFCYNEIFVPNTWGPLECLLGFWPSEPKPCGAMKENRRLVQAILTSTLFPFFAELCFTFLLLFLFFFCRFYFLFFSFFFVVLFLFLLLFIIIIIFPRQLVAEPSSKAC